MEQQVLGLAVVAAVVRELGVPARRDTARGAHTFWRKYAAPNRSRRLSGEWRLFFLTVVAAPGAGRTGEEHPRAPASRQTAASSPAGYLGDDVVSAFLVVVRHDVRFVQLLVDVHRKVNHVGAEHHLNLGLVELGRRVELLLLEEVQQREEHVRVHERGDRLRQVVWCRSLGHHGCGRGGRRRPCLADGRHVARGRGSAECRFSTIQFPKATWTHEANCTWERKKKKTGGTKTTRHRPQVIRV
eukprot:5541484-Prymnesium_polylepis.1